MEPPPRKNPRIEVEEDRENEIETNEQERSEGAVAEKVKPPAVQDNFQDFDDFPMDSPSLLPTKAKKRISRGRRSSILTSQIVSFHLSSKEKISNGTDDHEGDVEMPSSATRESGVDRDDEIVCPSCSKQWSRPRSSRLAGGGDETVCSNPKQDKCVACPFCSCQFSVNNGTVSKMGEETGRQMNAAERKKEEKRKGREERKRKEEASLVEGYTRYKETLQKEQREWNQLLSDTVAMRDNTANTIPTEDETLLELEEKEAQYLRNRINKTELWADFCRSANHNFSMMKLIDDKVKNKEDMLREEQKAVQKQIKEFVEGHKRLPPPEEILMKIKNLKIQKKKMETKKEREAREGCQGRDGNLKSELAIR